MPGITYEGLVDIDRLSLYHDKAKALFATGASQEALSGRVDGVAGDVAAVASRVSALEAAGGEPNAIEEVRVNGSALSPDASGAVDVSVPTKTSQLANDSGFQTAQQVSGTVSAAVSAALASAVTYRGSVATAPDLPASGNKVGDMWNVSADGMNHVWNGSAWDAQAPVVDLSGLVASSDVTICTNAQVNALFE